MSSCHGCPAATATLPRPVARPKTVALVGPPNSGKTTLFNRLTGLRQKVANFPGVTVEQHTGLAQIPGGGSVNIIDLPGVYSLNARSEDEQVTRDVLHGERGDTARPEAILLVLDSTNLTRHLMLAAPILALGLPTLVILNMADDLRSREGKVDAEALSEQLGAPVALVAARSGEGVDQVFSFLSKTMPALKRVELPVLQEVPKCRQWAGKVGNNARYHAPAPPIWTRRLDKIFLHPVIGPLVFVLVVVGVFQTIFTVGDLGDVLKKGLEISGNWIGQHISQPTVRSLIVYAVWKGVGSVVAFLPQILMLFLFIGILEDSGYLARAALIADRTMSRFGLQGKSFIPLLSAYACAVPAILATRTIENKRDRIATILIAPFMTCSARLPVYTLLIAAFIPERPVIGHLLGSRAATMLGLYVLGFVSAIFTARLLKSSILASHGTSFMLEMPSYRWPTLQSLGLRLWDRSKVFLRRAGTVILMVMLVLWVLEYLPMHNGQPAPIEQSLAAGVGHLIAPVIAPLGFNWKIGIGLVASLAARETIIGALSEIYSMGGGEGNVDLGAALQHDLTMGGAVALLIFFAFAMQCISTIAVVRRETGGWKWPAIQFAYMSALAYAGAFIAFHVVK